MLALAGGEAATPVLERLRPYVRRDGRAAVMLACGCELFAVRDALRLCPFEARPSLTTVSPTARVYFSVMWETSSE